MFINKIHSIDISCIQEITQIKSINGNFSLNLIKNVIRALRYDFSKLAFEF